MIRLLKPWGASVALFAASALLISAGGEGRAQPGNQVVQHFKYSQWPHPQTITGFAFNKADFSALDDYSIVKDEVSLADRILFSEEVSGMTCTVRRRIEFVHGNDQDKTIKIGIGVGGSSRIVSVAAIVPWFGMSSDFWMRVVRYGPDVAISAGDACIVYSIPEGATQVAETDVKQIGVKKNNVWFSLTSSDACDVNLVALARAMCTKIDDQITAGTSTTRPLASVTLTQDEVTIPAADISVETSLSYDATPTSQPATLSKKFYIARATNYRLDSDGGGETTPVGQEFPAGPTGIKEIRLDDESAPQSVIVTGPAGRGTFYIGIIAFEENLLPRIEHQEFRLID